jgi:hypothetical protein
LIVVSEDVPESPIGADTGHVVRPDLVVEATLNDANAARISCVLKPAVFYVIFITLIVAIEEAALKIGVDISPREPATGAEIEASPI